MIDNQLLNVVLKGWESSIDVADAKTLNIWGLIYTDADIVEETEFLQINLQIPYIKNISFIDQINSIEGLLSASTEIGFSDGTKDGYILYSKVKYVHKEHLGFRCSRASGLVLKIKCTFRIKE